MCKGLCHSTNGPTIQGHFLNDVRDPGKLIYEAVTARFDKAGNGSRIQHVRTMIKCATMGQPDYGFCFNNPRHCLFFGRHLRCISLPSSQTRGPFLRVSVTSLVADHCHRHHTFPSMIIRRSHLKRVLMALVICCVLGRPFSQRVPISAHTGLVRASICTTSGREERTLRMTYHMPSQSIEAMEVMLCKPSCFCSFEKGKLVRADDFLVTCLRSRCWQ